MSLAAGFNAFGSSRDSNRNFLINQDQLALGRDELALAQVKQQDTRDYQKSMADYYTSQENRAVQTDARNHFGRIVTGAMDTYQQGGGETNFEEMIAGVGSDPEITRHMGSAAIGASASMQQALKDNGFDPSTGSLELNSHTGAVALYATGADGKKSIVPGVNGAPLVMSGDEYKDMLRVAAWGAGVTDLENQLRVATPAQRPEIEAQLNKLTGVIEGAGYDIEQVVDISANGLDSAAVTGTPTPEQPATNTATTTTEPSMSYADQLAQRQEEVRQLRRTFIRDTNNRGDNSVLQAAQGEVDILQFQAEREELLNELESSPDLSAQRRNLIQSGIERTEANIARLKESDQTELRKIDESLASEHTGPNKKEMLLERREGVIRRINAAEIRANAATAPASAAPAATDEGLRAGRVETQTQTPAATTTAPTQSSAASGVNYSSGGNSGLRQGDPNDWAASAAAYMQANRSSGNTPNQGVIANLLSGDDAAGTGQTQFKEDQANIRNAANNALDWAKLEQTWATGNRDDIRKANDDSITRFAEGQYGEDGYGPLGRNWSSPEQIDQNIRDSIALNGQVLGKLNIPADLSQMSPAQLAWTMKATATAMKWHGASQGGVFNWGGSTVDGRYRLDSEIFPPAMEGELMWMNLPQADKDELLAEAGGNVEVAYSRLGEEIRADRGDIPTDAARLGQ